METVYLKLHQTDNILIQTSLPAKKVGWNQISKAIYCLFFYLLKKKAEYQSGLCFYLA